MGAVDRSEARGARRRTRVVALVGAFVVLDVVLVGLALGDRGEGQPRLTGSSAVPSPVEAAPTP